MVLFGLFKTGLFKNAMGFLFLGDKPWFLLSTIEEALQTIQILVELGMVLGYVKYLYEALLKVSSRSNIRKLIKTLHNLYVSSWRDVLDGLEMVSGSSKYPWEALPKVSSRSNTRKLVKTTPIIKVSS